MIKKTRKSQGHIEMIVSFFLFITSLIIIFYLLNPVMQTSTKTPDTSRISGILVKNLSYEYGKLVIILKDSGDNYAYTLSDYIDTNGPIKYYEKEETPTKYIVYFSELFETEPLPGFNSPKHNCKYDGSGNLIADTCEFSKGSYSIESFVVYEEIKKIKEQYDSNYKKLKRELGINRDFSFSVKNPNGIDLPEISISPKKVPAGRERGSFDIPIRVINKSADIKELIINVKTW
jgi:hypothetical protein